MAAILVFSAGGPLFAANPPSTTLPDIIDNIRRNEALYDNFEMRCEVRMVPTVERDSDWNAKYRVIFQQGRHYAWKEETRSWGQDVHELAFDGIATRQRRSNGEPRLDAGSQNLQNSDFAPFAARPHMILWLACGVLNHAGELSDFLGTAITEDKESVRIFPSNTAFEVLQLNDEVVDGLRCHHVLLRRLSYQRTAPRYLVELWIAPDRNYLPLRVAYVQSTEDDITNSNRVVRTEGELKDLREIAPGVWYPGEIHWKEISEFPADDDSAEPKTVVHHHLRARVTEINHNPDYPVEFFRAIEIPSRSFVAEEEIPAETVTEPAPAETGEIAETSPWWKWPPLYMLALVIIGITASRVQRARRKGLERQKPANPG